MFQRYAIYHAPDGALAQLGASWLGRDAQSGPLPHGVADLPGCRPMAELTTSARRYGLHGTLKPPMRLAEGFHPDDLIETLSAFAAQRAPVEIGTCRVAALGPFLAVVAVEQPAALDRLAADLVRDMDRFRAPPSEAELARRKAQGLSQRQLELLDAWGYPYVMEEFRFHITLSDALTDSERAPVMAAAEAHLAPALAEPVTLGDLAVFGEDESGVFHLITRLPLRG